MTIKEQIEAELQPLLGEPLSDMMRYASCQKFEFGRQRPAKNRKGEDITLGDWGVVISCEWRITGPEGLVVSFDDFGPGRERRDESALSFYDLLHSNSPRIETMQADEKGGLLFHLTEGYTVEIIPKNQNDLERWAIHKEPRQKLLSEGELWRFMPKEEPDDQEPEHFVVTTSGIEGPSDRRVYFLYKGILADDYEKVRALLEQEVTPQYNPYYDEETLLKVAAMESTTEIVRLLLEYGAGDGGDLPFIAAARGGQIETVRLFWEMGSDVNQQDEIGWTALMEASSWGYQEIVHFLVEKGADVMHRTQRGNTALDVARHDEQPEVAEYLLAHGAQQESPNRDAI